MKKPATFRTNSAQEYLPNVITYYREDYTAKSGKCQVYLYVYLNYTRITFKTGVFVKPSEWIADKQIVSKSHPEASDLNLIISNCRARVSDILVKYRLQFEQITPDLLKSEYARPSVKVDFLQFFDDAIKERKGEIADTTATLHRCIRTKLQAYKNPIAFSELTEDFFVGYNRYLKVTHKDGQNTRHNNLKIIKTYLKIAMRKKLLDTNPLLKMPVRRGSVERCFLTEDELKKLILIYRTHKISPTWHQILSRFIFAAVTGGLRISDIKRIKMEDIIGNILVFAPHKLKNVNAITIKVPLAPLSWECIKNESPYRVSGRIFHYISDQNTNDYLKDIAKYAEIAKPISFGYARHTFATMFLRKTNNLAALQKLLGHSKITQTMEYAHILTDDLETEMRVFSDF